MACLRKIFKLQHGYLFNYRKLISQPLPHFTIRKDLSSNPVLLQSVSVTEVESKSKSDSDISSLESENHFDVMNKHVKNTEQKYGKREPKNFYKVSLKLSQDFHEAESLPTLKKVLEVASLSLDNSMRMVKRLFWKYQVSKTSALQESDVDKIVKCREFRKVLATLEKRAHMLTSEDLYNLFKFVLCFKVPPTNELTIKLAHLLMASINKYSTTDIINLHVELDKKEFKDIEVFNSLKLACYNFLVFCFKNKMQHKCSASNAAFYATIQSLPKFVRQGFLKMLKNQTFEKFSPWSYIHVLKSLQEVSLEPEEHSIISEKTLQNLIENMSKDWPLSAIVNIVGIYHMGVIRKHFNYDENLCNKVAWTVVEADANMKLSINVLYVLTKIYHFHYDLFQHVLTKSKREAEETSTVFAKNLGRLLGIFRYIGFLESEDSNTLEYLKDKIILSDFLVSSSPEFEHEKFRACLDIGLGLASLDVYKKEIIEKIFEITEKKFTTEVKSFRGHSYSSILLLYQWATSVTTVFEEKLSKEILQEAWTHVNTELTTFTWKEIIEEMFGGSDYVLTNCKTSKYHSLSFAVVLGPENKPVNLSCYKTNETAIDLESVHIPENSKLVIIQEFPETVEYEFRNLPHLLSGTKLYLQVLDSLGYTVIPVRDMNLVSVTDFEKPLYMKALIKEKIGEINLNG